jgi:DNA-binding transcriptional MerR regulator
VKIKEVSEKYGISKDTLRYYEKIGLIPQVKRDKNGVREYTEADCKLIELIKCMRSAGVEIEALVEYVKLLQKGDSTIEARKRILIEQREKLIARLEAIQKAIDRLNFKIESYESLLLSVERDFKKEKITSK